MKTHTFTGASAREVLQKVKQALGEDAMILSNRPVAGGVEMIALAPESANEIAPAPVVAAPAPVQAPAPAPAAAMPRTLTPADLASFTRALNNSAAPAAVAAPAPVAPVAPVIAEPVAAPVAAPRQSVEMEGILNEIQTLKSMLRQDIAAIQSLDANDGAPAKSPVLRDLLNAGFSPALARRVSTEAAGEQPVTMQSAAIRLECELPVADADEIVNRGGIYALVGPTGVGKTTTVAKLAARAVVRFGASKVALLTTDSYRIGAQDQLRIYGRLLSIPVHTIRDSAELAQSLAELKDRHLILIDTIGMSQRDRRVAEQAAMLAQGGAVKSLLLVATTTNTATLNQVVSAYKATGVAGCILTKIDEAASLAPAIDAVIRHELPVHYVTDGQRVPEDLQLPSVSTLVRQSLHPLPEEDCELANDEVALIAHSVMPAPAAVVAPQPEIEMPVMPVHAIPQRTFAGRVVHG